MDEVKVIQVIYCTKHRRGNGKSENDPVRIIPEIFTLEGEKIMEDDSSKIFTRQDLYVFASLLKNSKQTADEAVNNFIANFFEDNR